jgi:hypothetical protein
MSELEPPRLARLAGLAGLAHLGFDTLSRLWPATSPPWLLTPHLAEGFRDMLEMLGRTPVSLMTSAVQGAISAIFALALQPVATRRLASLAALLLFVWLLSGGLMFALYLSAPGWLVATSLAAGVPRALAVAFFLDRGMARPAPPTGQAAVPGL